jgi:hypothetical protein
VQTDNPTLQQGQTTTSNLDEAAQSIDSTAEQGSMVRTCCHFGL